MSQHGTFLNLPQQQQQQQQQQPQPQPQSNPDTPSEMPGTPTSTTTSLSAVSTTAIKDGHRGSHHHAAPGQRGHQHNLSTNSLEAERADRISRLPGFSAVQTSQRGGANSTSGHNAPGSSQTTPTSSGFPAVPAVTATTAPGGLTPAFFDAAGQPTAATKMSTVGTASATESLGGRTTTETETGGDHDMGDGDEDMLSMDTNFRGADTEATAAEMEDDTNSGYMMGQDAMMDEDMATRSVGGFEDRTSDDGSASLVGFGEGAGSTVSGPIYQRRPLPGGGGSSAGAMERMVYGLERSSSGLSDVAMLGSGRRDTVRGPPDQQAGSLAQALLHQQGNDRETPVNASAAAERREARMVDGVTLNDPAAAAAVATGVANDDVFVDTTTRGPVSIQAPTSALRETQQPNSPYQQQQRQAQLRMMHHHQHPQGAEAVQMASSSREAAERILRETLDNDEARVGKSGLSSPQGGEKLGRFYFEDRK